MHNRHNNKQNVNKVNSKGDWEFSFFQKKYDPNEEAIIKLSMKPENGFNPKNVHNYINPDIPEEKILIKKEQGHKLSTRENIILNNYLNIKETKIKNDIKMVKDQGLLAKPTTKIGRGYLLLKMLDHQLEKKNENGIANIYLRMMEKDYFEFTPELLLEHTENINKMNEIVKTLDIIKLQFTEFYAQMPPLNTKGFQKFDEWQIKVINNIDNKISTMVNAPTSAGKSVLSGYAIAKYEKVLAIVPTDALAWQMSSYFTNIINSNIPIVTNTYQTIPKRNELIELIKHSKGLVGTPDAINDILPFIDCKYEYIIFDEIHMIGRNEGMSMEHIIKLLSKTPILALSATIGNTDELVEWFETIINKKMDKIICSDRYFNLQKLYYDENKNDIIRLNPLALVNELQIKDKSILIKNLQPTPPDIWDLYIKLSNSYDLEDLDIYKYFNINQRIELNEANKYFNKLINFVVNKYDNDKNNIMGIINSYKDNITLPSTIDLPKFMMKLKENNKTPAIIFQKNTVACLRMVRNFAKDIETLEMKTYPKLIQERMKLAKYAKRMEKHKPETNDKKEKNINAKTQLKKAKYGETIDNEEKNIVIDVPSLQEPHSDFIFNTIQYFTDNMVESWVNDLKKYFPNSGEYYHFIIKLLWRGVGVYAKGLPDPYLRLVQSLACQKQLAIVFSDISLVFGVSMPFRTVVIIRDNKLIDDLDPMISQQMCGRAGRRGLDKEGNIIYLGYTFERMKELSISEPPNVKGCNTIVYTVPHANEISKTMKTNQNWDCICNNLLDKTISNEESNEILENIKINYENGWNFGLVKTDINHLHMNWKLRYNNDCLLISYLIPYIKRAFEGKDHTIENNQIELAHFLCRYICTKETDIDEYVLTDPKILNEFPYNNINKNLEELEIELPLKIDNRLYISIQQNYIFKNNFEDETDKLRHEIFEFGEKIKCIQHLFFHSKISLAKIFGKLLTRIWWIYHTSSPIMKPIHTYDIDEYVNVEE